MPFAVRTYDSAAAFLDRAGPWLLQAEAEHSLVLGIAGRLAGAVPEGVSEAAGPAYLATVEADGAVAGVALRTPPHKLIVTRMPPGAVPALAEAVAGRFERLPAVLGPPGVAEAFGVEWARRHAVTPTVGMRQRVFELTRLVPPGRSASGGARPAAAGDLDRVARWIAAFEAEAGVSTPSDPRAWAERHVTSGRVLLWADGDAPVSMAAEIARSPNGARVGAVYTPPAHRGRGYGSAVVAALSARLLAGGARFCALYTDLANPTSNAIYRRLGYVPVADAVDVEFTPVR